jgi:hypothetical protein
MIQRWQLHSLHFVNVEAKHGRGFGHYFCRMDVPSSVGIGSTHLAENASLDFWVHHAIATTNHLVEI